MNSLDIQRGEVSDEHVETDAVAAHDDQVGRLDVPAEEGHLHDLALRDVLGVGRYLEEAVRLGEGGDRSRALAQGEGEHSLSTPDQADERELRTPSVARHPPRKVGAHRGAGSLAQAEAPPEDGRDERVEREDRGGREARQDHDALAVPGGEAERLARFEGHAVRGDLAVRGHGALGHVAFALARPPREEHEVVVRQRVEQRLAHACLVVADDPQRLGLGADLPHGVDPEGRVRVVYLAGCQYGPGRDNLVSGGDHGHTGAAYAGHAGEDAGRESAGFAGGEVGATPQDHLAAGHVGSCRADPRARHGGMRHAHAALSVDLRVLDHHDGVRAARDDRSGGHGDRLSRADLGHGGATGRYGLGRRLEEGGRGLVGSEGVLGADGPAVHVRAVEGGDVAGRGEIRGQDAAQGARQGHLLRLQGREVQDRVPALASDFRRQDVEELFLLHGPRYTCLPGSSLGRALPRSLGGTP